MQLYFLILLLLTILYSVLHSARFWELSAKFKYFPDTVPAELVSDPGIHVLLHNLEHVEKIVEAALVSHIVHQALQGS